MCGKHIGPFRHSILFLYYLKQTIRTFYLAINGINQLKAETIGCLFSILAEMFTTPEKSKKDTVAVIYVEGPILPGHSQPGPFGSISAAFSGDIRKALEKAARDDTVKAVVMRVNSPGGSATASEVILNATRRVKTKKAFCYLDG